MPFWICHSDVAMRILFSSPPAVGHIHPMLPLARELQARGHDVRWATGRNYVEHLQRAGFQVHESGLDNLELRSRYRASYPEPPGMTGPLRRRHVLPNMFGRTGTPPMVESLEALAGTWPPDLMVHDAAEFGAAIVGGRRGIPHVTHGFGAIIPTEVLALAGDALAELWSEHGLPPDRLAGSYQHLYLAICPPSMQLPDIAEAGRVQLLWPGPADVVAAPGAHAFNLERGTRPLIYATFGTVENRNPAFAAAVTALAGLDADLLVTVGADGDPAPLGPQPPNVRVERYVPQAEVLGRCDLVVSHAGSGTLYAGLARGVPQLCMPQSADQFVNADATARVGAGLTLVGDQAEPSAIAGAARRLLTEPGFRAGASAVASDIQSMPGPADAAPVLESLATTRG